MKKLERKKENNKMGLENWSAEMLKRLHEEWCSILNQPVDKVGFNPNPTKKPNLVVNITAKFKLE